MAIALVNKFKHWVSGDHYDEELYAHDDDASDYRGQDYRGQDMEEYESLNGGASAGQAAGSPMSDRGLAASARSMANSRFGKANLRVVDHPSVMASQVVVVEPRSFEDSLVMVEHLRNRRTVVLNLHLLDMAQSQRVVDFLAGATHAIDGHQKRIGEGVFLFTPSNVSISTELDKAVASGASAYWQAS
ncbi:MAG: cell division protein SepF [Vampirovibrionales bacterium]|nr:cell division protein SepF [Vampirovibrionales bacterium]